MSCCYCGWCNGRWKYINAVYRVRVIGIGLREGLKIFESATIEGAYTLAVVWSWKHTLQGAESGNIFRFDAAHSRVCLLLQKTVSFK